MRNGNLFPPGSTTRSCVSLSLSLVVVVIIIGLIDGASDSCGGCGGSCDGSCSNGSDGGGCTVRIGNGLLSRCGKISFSVSSDDDLLRKVSQQQQQQQQHNNSLRQRHIFNISQYIPNIYKYRIKQVNSVPTFMPI